MPYDSRMFAGTIVMLVGVVVAGVAGLGHVASFWTEHTMFIVGGVGLAIVAIGGMFATGGGNLPP